MKINLLTCCPEYFDSVLTSSILGRARRQGKVAVTVWCLRDFADGKKKKIVDDEPYGGGAGQIMKVEPIYRCLEHLRTRGEVGQSYLLSARGELFRQQTARAWSELDFLTLVCGHYEGVDERVKQLVTGEVSLGQFVLTGGEAAAAAMVDATVRLLPGVLGNQESLREESFNDGCLEYPQYTRPQEFQGLKVPEVLLTGHHAEIAKWRRDQCRKV